MRNTRFTPLAAFRRTGSYTPALLTLFSFALSLVPSIASGSTLSTNATTPADSTAVLRASDATHAALADGSSRLQPSFANGANRPFAESATRNSSGTNDIDTTPVLMAAAQNHWRGHPRSSTLQVKTTSLPSGAVGTSYSARIAATGGTGSYTCSVASGALNAGLTLSGCNITGNPSTSGTSTFAITVADSSGTTAQSGSLGIAVAAAQSTPLTISAPPSGTVNVRYAASIGVTGGTAPYTCSISSGALPTGLAMSNCAISGTPSSAGSSSFLVKVTDSASPAGSATATVALVINPTSVAVTSLTLISPPAATAGSSYTGTIGVSGGTAPYTCTVASGSLPAGLTLGGCSLTGTPTTAGNYSASITATDASSPANTGTSSIAVTVNAAASTGSAVYPHINYTDLNAGSGTGGDNGNGVYVRIFGSHFGASQGSSTVTLGGLLVTNCSLCSWSDTQIVAQLGGSATTGQIVVTANGLASNGAPFTVTPTTIVFVSPNGSDSNSGTFASPFKSWRAAFNSVTSNDSKSPSQNAVIYLEPGVNVSSDDGRGYSAAISTDLGGSSTTNQLAIVGYPGGTVNVGSTGIANGVHGWGKYLTIANLSIVGQNSAIDAEAGNVRIINNSLSCPAPPSGLGGTACVLGETTNPADTWVFQGNNVHDTGGNVDKTYHAVYFSSNVNHADVGWNNVGQNFKGYCRGIMFHATTGSNQYDLHVHDNIVTNSYCDGIELASVDPSQGSVDVFNNVVSNAALSTNPYGVANEAGIAINSDPAGSTSGTVEVDHNTVVNAGAYTTGNQNGCFGVVTAGAGLHLTNNICSQPSASQPYIESGSQNVSGSNNLWYGAGPAPSFDSAPVNSNPDFVSATNFALQPGSPAKSMGITTSTSTIDILGVPWGYTPSMGAFQ